MCVLCAGPKLFIEIPPAANFKLNKEISAPSAHIAIDVGCCEWPRQTFRFVTRAIGETKTGEFYIRRCVDGNSLKTFPQRGKQFVRTQTRCVRNFVCQTPSLALAKLIREISNGHDRWWHKHKYTQVIRDFIIVGLRFVSSSSSSVCTNYKTLTQSRLASIEIKRENGNQLVNSTRINSS